MYAIIENGNKQYKVSEGDIVKLEKLNAAVDEKVELNVIMVVDGEHVKLGDEIANAKVSATVVRQDKEKKIIVFKYKAKKNVRKKQGHRQPYTAVKIDSISL